MTGPQEPQERRWGWWLPVGPRELRGLAVGAYFLAGEHPAWAVGQAAAGRPAALRRELAKVWKLTGVVDDRRLLRFAAEHASDAVVVDQVLAAARSGAPSPPGTPSAVVDALVELVSVLQIAPAELPASVWAWEHARSVQLVRQAVTAGYLTPEDAWVALGVIGDATSSAYTTWEEFAWGFEVGRALHMAIGSRSPRRLVEESIQHTRPHVQALLHHPGSPWLTVPLSGEA